jgi:signal transduction histidine kinase
VGAVTRPARAPAAHDAPRSFGARRPDLVDAAVAVLLACVLVVISTQVDHDRGERNVDAGAYVLVVAAALPLAVRRRWPVVALAGTTVALLVYLGFDYPGGPVYLTPLVSVYTLAQQRERRDALVPSGIAVGLLTVLGVAGDAGNGWIHLVYVTWAAGAHLLGEAARHRRERVAALEERARFLEESHEEEALRRMAEERLRLARDVHDVVAHSLASISVQAGVGAHVIDQRPDEARAALLAIKQVSREALGELRSMLGVLREGGEDDGAPLAPTPGLDGLGTLVGRVEQAGIAVALAVEGDVRPLAPAVDVAAYRIVQESLTNVLRHAGPARAAITVTYHDGCVEVEVVDDGRGAAASPDGVHAESGHGIAGMRERATSVGGEVDAGPRPGGGFRVRARLPVGAGGGR